MAINISQAFAGQPIRTPVAGELAAQRGSPRTESAAPVAEVEQSITERRVAEAAEANAESGISVAIKQTEEVDLTKAVEQANAAAESALRATNRSIVFEKDDNSGRVKITITEEVNGEEVTRQIPPNEFLKVAERLRELSAEGSEAVPPRGTLINVDV